MQSAKGDLGGLTKSIMRCLSSTHFAPALSESVTVFLNKEYTANYNSTIPLMTMRGPSWSPT